MLILVFDTETTGLPKTKFINPHALTEWPYIVQLSYLIYDTDINDIICMCDHIIKLPDGINIPEDSAKIHGITNELSNKKGENIEIILEDFFRNLQQCDEIVGHNISFDINMIKIELLRIIYAPTLPSDNYLKYIKLNLHFLNNLKNIQCTLRNSIELCNIQAVSKGGKQYLKFPKLIELHEKLFTTRPNNLHNALNDILITLRCHMKIKYNIDLLDKCSTFINNVKILGLI